ncbi:MAG: hypothetical protein PWP49_577 [Thermococcaceae archaeon]|jgi:Uri superfamily endonuclease|uniref:GIY-YIG nuclease family protein n=1 Tax=Thermococcus TaxID=2263 RepID=UPI00074ABA84|nr:MULTISPECIES: DUF123 domain-containing protein [Thermococcus]KUJ98871.1 MAG: Endonuclease [Thermococcales archaeon 44_46]MDK2783623.1 hypothetical protein [Thermococcaceae archaeon]MCA6212899.1 DUF123 domain-containing protein [Thermococcus bergensis]MDK2983469.1 hypothetical protein [Thermococcaceae archaeon]MDN5320157.1 hypothetical protein [Thermococcaceae archaeon]
MKGSYLLVIYLERDANIRTKAREFRLKKGYYIYVGSAMNSLEKRVARHFKKKKRLHWHIDFLLQKARLLSAYLIPSEERLEEELSRTVGEVFKGIEGFGASDVGVKTNLYYSAIPPDGTICNILNSRGPRWKRVKSYEDIMNWREENAENGEG